MVAAAEVLANLIFGTMNCFSRVDKSIVDQSYDGAKVHFILYLYSPIKEKSNQDLRDTVLANSRFYPILQIPWQHVKSGPQ